jgi:hypothetical protein
MAEYINAKHSGLYISSMARYEDEEKIAARKR